LVDFFAGHSASRFSTYASVLRAMDEPRQSPGARRSTLLTFGPSNAHRALS
jgi:hypothetical protein